MFEIRIHGRGGQGAVIASQILAYAFFLEGRFAQSFPTFGAERRGAPVAAFVRVDQNFINLRCQVTTPQQVIVLSARLTQTVDVSAGVEPGGLILINSEQHKEAFLPFLDGSYKVVTLDVNRIALQFSLGTLSMPLVNAPILGAYAKISGIVKKENLLTALPRFVPSNLENNKQALLAAYEQAPKQQEEQ